MNSEVTLSTALPQIELEIGYYKQIAGQSIWEIGRRLNHVKENDLAHGQFTEWVEKQGIHIREAQRMMVVAKELPNTTTLSHLGTTALHLIATLPDDAKAEQMEKIEAGDSPTVKELQELKKQLKAKDQALEAVTAENQQLRDKPPEVVTKTVEVKPDDYDSVKKLNKDLLSRNKSLADDVERLAELEAELAQMKQAGQSYQSLQADIAQLKQGINKHKQAMAFIEKASDALADVQGKFYENENYIRNADGVVNLEFTNMAQRFMRVAEEMVRLTQNNYIEGEIL